jgi:nucleotide-binding universal stress UspA family protein
MRCAPRSRMKILLPVDLSDCSTAAIEAVLKQFAPREAAVRLLHVVDWEQHLPASYLFIEGPDAAKTLLAERDRIMRDLLANMRDLEKRFAAAGFSADVELEGGDRPDRAILNAARAWQADLIVMGSHGRTGLSRWILGSVAEAVMRHAPCPVQIIGDTSRGKSQRNTSAREEPRVIR